MLDSATTFEMREFLDKNRFFLPAVLDFLAVRRIPVNPYPSTSRLRNCQSLRHWDSIR
jgi:hypothetical protein